MYLEGLRQEGILVSSDYPTEQPVPPRPEIGKPMELGPKQVDLSRLGQRTVTVARVNWEPPE